MAEPEAITFLPIRQVQEGIVNQALGGSVNEISANYSAHYKSNLSSINRPGVYMFMTSDRGFRNRLLPGDSGSGFFVYDTVAQKWVLVGGFIHGSG